MDGTTAVMNGDKTKISDILSVSKLNTMPDLLVERGELISRRTKRLVESVETAHITMPATLADIQLDVSLKANSHWSLDISVEGDRQRTVEPIPKVSSSKAPVLDKCSTHFTPMLQDIDTLTLRRSVSADDLQTPASSTLSSVSYASGSSSASPKLLGQEHVSMNNSVVSTVSGRLSDPKPKSPAVSSDRIISRGKSVHAPQKADATKGPPLHPAHILQSSEESRSSLNAGEHINLPGFSGTSPVSPKNPNRSRVKRCKIRQKSSVSINAPTREYARQCIAAAESSRLNPHALHVEEYAILREHISHAQVTAYLNIRNAILRLWLRKSHIAITKDEAIGCAKDSRWSQVASVCYDWLVRRGYLNHGCVEVKQTHRDGDVQTQNIENKASRLSSTKKKTIAIIGAGMAGLGCARQLHNLFKQQGDLLAELGLEEPDVIVLEGRSRIGGRVYSRSLQVQPRHRHPEFHQSRCIAEMGGMVVTGFDRGNPMNVLIRGQLGLGYYALLSTATIYDTDGNPVDAKRDRMVEDLFNECLDRVSKYKFKVPLPKIIEGNRDYIDQGRDYPSEGHQTIATVEVNAAAQKQHARTLEDAKVEERQIPEQSQSAPATPHRVREREATCKGREMPAIKGFPQAHQPPKKPATMIAGLKLKTLGWKLKPGVGERQDIDLDPAASVPGTTLGCVVEEAIRQFGDLVDLSAQDFRLLNWHIANLEYSNAVNHDRLSLLGWDIDAGNEWEGKHSMIIGGYQSVPRGLMLCPTPLHVRKQMVVKKVSYGEPDGASLPGVCKAHNSSVVIEFEDGSTFDADYVVNTIPLGVLKHGDVEYDPPLPQWKLGPITRLGYGVLNKIILTYRQPFWDTERDIFGVLREPDNRFSLNQKQYAKHRGRMFQWFDVTKTTGVPCLIALMAGDAAVDTEKDSNDKLIAEATSVLRNVFGAQNVPEPIEAVVTRWASDRFSRGSYSSAGPAMQLDDYDAMARPVGRHLHFAGEHTIGTHPATVHGAYLSGLRAASDIFEELVGPIKVPVPLVIPKDSLLLTLKRKLTLDEEGVTMGSGSSGSNNADSGGSTPNDAKASARRRLEVPELPVGEQISKQPAGRPPQPPRRDDSPYQLFSKANYKRASKICEQSRRPGKRRPAPEEVRAVTSKMWRSASIEERLPYAEEAAARKQEYDVALTAYNADMAEWDRRSAEERGQYGKDHSKDIDQDLKATTSSVPISLSDLGSTTPDRTDVQHETTCTSNMDARR